MIAKADANEYLNVQCMKWYHSPSSMVGLSHVLFLFKLFIREILDM